MSLLYHVNMYLEFLILACTIYILASISAALGEDGRILLRESGTEPVIRVMVEAQSDELCAKYVDEMVQVIREEGLAVE